MYYYSAAQGDGLQYVVVDWLHASSREKVKELSLDTRHWLRRYGYRHLLIC